MKHGQSLLLLLLLVLGLFAIACSGSSSDDDDDDGIQPTDGDAVVTDGDGNTTDDDDDGGIIIPDADGDSTDGDDETREGCRYDTDCPGNQYCYHASTTSAGRCVDRKQECESCTDHRECLYTTDYCLPGNYHGGGVCGSDCGNGLECPTNYVCTVIPELDDAKQCVFDVTLAQGTQGSPCCVHEDCNLPLSCRPRHGG